MADEERIEFISDFDGTLIQTYVDGQPCIPGAETFVEKWGPKTVLLSVGVESFQIKKLVRANLHFRNRLIVPDEQSKIDRIWGIAEHWNRRQKPIVIIGDRLDVDMAPGWEAGLVTVRMRHPSGKYSRWEPRSRAQVPDFTVTNFHELMELPIFR